MDVGCWGRGGAGRAGAGVLSQSGEKYLTQGPPITMAYWRYLGRASFEASENEASEWRYLG